MEITAKARFVRQSPRKVRLVSNLIKGLPLPSARAQLKFLPKKAAGVVLKTLESAAANAKNNHKLEADNLFVAAAFVDQGPTLKRFTPKAFGRAAQIRKRTSHLTIVLSDKKEDNESSKSESRNSKQTRMTKIQNSKQSGLF